LFERQQIALGNEYYKGNLPKMISEICKFIPIDSDEKVPESIDYAKLESDFNSQYYPINGDARNKIMNMYQIYDARTIYETYGLDAVMHGSYSAIVRDKPGIVDIDKIISNLRKTIKPTRNTLIKCESYRNTCGVINTLADMVIPITKYENKRLTMPDPKKYIQFKCKVVILKINNDTYHNTLKKCCDFIENGKRYQSHPY
jgi:hypothetical protein